MALQIEDPEIERRILEMSEERNISPEALVRLALDAESARVREKYERVMRHLEDEVWPHIPPDQLGKRLTKEEEEELLGYGPGEY